MEELKKLKIPFIDLVCVDLYPLEEAIAKPDADYEFGHRSNRHRRADASSLAAKGGRIVICDPEDRDWVIEEIRDKWRFGRREKS